MPPPKFVSCLKKIQLNWIIFEGGIALASRWGAEVSPRIIKG